MALINCPECGKEISDNAKKCPNCGYPISKKKITIGELEWNDFYNKHKKKIIGIAIGLIILIIGSIYANMQATQNQKEDYETELVTVASAMYLDASNAEELCNLTAKVWYNAIYQEESYETDKYTKKSNGFWVGDFNDAISALYADKIDECTSLKENQEEIDEIMGDLKNPSEEYEECYDALTDVYSAYRSLIDLAIDPTGSYTSFCSSKNEKIDNFVSAYTKLQPLLPDIGDDSDVSESDSDNY
ncbi:MAG: zinc ribbon domain-containing protein [Candidatus Fimousia sp.]